MQLHIQVCCLPSIEMVKVVYTELFQVVRRIYSIDILTAKTKKMTSQHKQDAFNNMYSLTLQKNFLSARYHS